LLLFDPVLNAVLAEGVAALSDHWVGEEFDADGALKLSRTHFYLVFFYFWFRFLLLFMIDNCVVTLV
jgi:hypothetical protein